VSKVTFIGHSITAAQRGFAVTGNIQCKTDAWGKVVPIFLPQPTHRAILRDLDAAVANALLQSAAGTKIEVGIEFRVLVVLHAVILIAQAEIQSYSRSNAPRIVNVGSPLVVDVAATERR